MRSSELLDDLLDQCEAAMQSGKPLSLDSLCGNDPELLGELKNRLDALDAMDRLLANQPSISSDVSDSPTISTPDGTLNPAQFLNERASPIPTIHGYTLERVIGQGGQGVVYEGTQISTNRKVAIKILPAGTSGIDAHLARFEREVKVLAALDHPGIVGLIDRGTTASSAPYVVLHFVSGDRLDRWAARVCESHNADAGSLLVRLLRVFLRVCTAVQAAHQRGIIHRDLKPSNVLVDAHDQPHVLDFGLARPMFESDSSVDEGPVTQTGQFVGSLPWASPEQAEGNWSSVDARTDVYALGVMLYQALTGRFPYDVQSSMREVLNNIVMVWPSPPSQSAAASASKGKSSAATHRTPLALTKSLDQTVLRALHKSPAERHSNAGELGRELEEHLSHVLAGAKHTEATRILASKHERRRPPHVRFALFIGLIAILILLAATVHNSLFLSVPSDTDLNVLGANNEGSQLDFDLAHDKAKALVAAGEPNAAVEAWRELIPLMLESETIPVSRQRIIVMEAAATAQRLRDWKSAQEWLNSLSDTLSRRIGDDSPMRVAPLIHLSAAYQSNQLTDEAAKCLDTATAILNRHRAGGSTSVDVEMLLLAQHYSMKEAYDLALLWSLRSAAHRYVRLGNDTHEEMVICWRGAQQAFARMGLTESAKSVAAAETPGLAKDDHLNARATRLRVIAVGLTNISVQDRITLYASEAATLMQGAIALVETIEDPGKRLWLGNLWVDCANVHKDAGDSEAALAAYYKAIPLRNEMVGGKDAWIYGLLGGYLIDLARYSEAEPHLKNSLESYEANPAQLDTQHQWMVVARRIQLASVYCHLKRWEESRQLFEQGLESLEHLPDDYAYTIRRFGGQLLQVYAELRLVDEATKLKEIIATLDTPAKPSATDPAKVAAVVSALAFIEQTHPWPSVQTVDAERALAEELQRAGQSERALIHAARATAGRLVIVKGDDLHPQMLQHWQLLEQLFTNLKNDHSARRTAEPMSASPSNVSDPMLLARALRLSLLADNLGSREMHREAELPIQQSIKLAEQASQPNQGFLASQWGNLAFTRHFGNLPDAETAFERAIALRDMIVPGGDAWGRIMFGGHHRIKGKHELAEPLYRKGIEIYEVMLKESPSPQKDLDMAGYRLHWADTLLALKRTSEARQQFELGIAVYESTIASIGKERLPSHMRMLNEFWPRLLATYRTLELHDEALRLEERIAKLRKSQ